MISLTLSLKDDGFIEVIISDNAGKTHFKIMDINQINYLINKSQEVKIITSDNNDIIVLHNPDFKTVENIFKYAIQK